MNDKKTNFISRNGETISEHSITFGSTAKGLEETVSTVGAGMSFANKQFIKQTIKNGNNVVLIDGKGDISFARKYNPVLNQKKKTKPKPTNLNKTNKF